MKVLDPHIPLVTNPPVNDLSELISKARSGFTVDERAHWYPILPKIVLGKALYVLLYFKFVFVCVFMPK